MADDPLAPVQPGDDITKLVSAARHNAYAQAARTVNGSLPVRWKREPKSRGPHAMRRFELKSALSPGSSVDAYPLDADGEPITDDEDAVFTVNDVRGIYRGRATDAYSSPHDQGSRGEAVWRNGSWEIDWLTPHALMIRGTLTDDLETTDSTFTIDNVGIMQPTGSIIVNQDPATAMTINNLFNWEGDDDGVVIAAWNQHLVRWEAVNVECPA